MSEVFETAAFVTLGIVGGVAVAALVIGLGIWGLVVVERKWQARNAQVTR